MQRSAVLRNSIQNNRKEYKTTQRKFALPGGFFTEVILLCQPSTIRDMDKVAAPEG
jgi:hypothetical protein